MVSLCNGNKVPKKKLVHRLVAEAFIPNPNNLPEVNHIDYNNKNNNVQNLEWCDRGYNMAHCFKNILRLEIIDLVLYIKIII